MARRGRRPQGEQSRTRDHSIGDVSAGLGPPHARYSPTFDRERRDSSRERGGGTAGDSGRGQGSEGGESGRARGEGLGRRRRPSTAVGASGKRAENLMTYDPKAIGE